MSDLPEINFKKKKKKRGFLPWLRQKLGFGGGASGGTGVSGGTGAVSKAVSNAGNLGKFANVSKGAGNFANLGKNAAFGVSNMGASTGFLSGVLGGKGLMIAAIASVIIGLAGIGLYVSNRTSSAESAHSIFNFEKAITYIPSWLRQKNQEGSSLDMFNKTNRGALFGEENVKADTPKDGDGSKGDGGNIERNSGHDVNVEDLIRNAAGGNNSGLFGDLMGSNLADRHGGSGVGNGPYMNKNLMAMNVGVAGKYDGKYDGVYDKAAEAVPLAGRPVKTNKRKMGKASGFSWTNAGYKGRKNKMSTRIDSKKRAMFQLAETYSMTGSAVTSGGAAPEYQSSYMGSTYDGNDINSDLLETNMGGAIGALPAIPDIAFVEELLIDVEKIQEVAMDCMEAQADEQLDEKGNMIDRVSRSLGSPPKCCKRGAVKRWNKKLKRLTSMCNSFNSSVARVAEKCQSAGGGQKMDCGQWNSMRISPCSKLKCWAAFFLILLGIFSFGFVAMFLTFALFGVIKFDLKNMGGKLDSMMSFIASGGNYDNVEGAGDTSSEGGTVSRCHDDGTTDGT
ncbi:MAG: hypothetical protein KAI33_07835, partial [Elusimicrobiales bacterium]|nr:hypothetical protein [Elusimicrobiales bacterium]